MVFVKEWDGRGAEGFENAEKEKESFDGEEGTMEVACQPGEPQPTIYNSSTTFVPFSRTCFVMRHTALNLLMPSFLLAFALSSSSTSSIVKASRTADSQRQRSCGPSSLSKLAGG